MKEYLRNNMTARKGPLIITKNNFVFLCAIMIFSILLCSALSLCSALFFIRNLLTSFSTSVLLSDFFVTIIKYGETKRSIVVTSESGVVGAG